MDIVTDNLQDVLSGIMSRHRITARIAGKDVVRVKIPLEDIREGMLQRLAKLDDITDGEIPSFVVPTTTELREKWLPPLIAGGTAILTDDTLELDVIVPPKRKAHAR